MTDVKKTLCIFRQMRRTVTSLTSGSIPAMTREETSAPSSPCRDRADRCGTTRPGSGKTNVKGPSLASSFVIIGYQHIKVSTDSYEEGLKGQSWDGCSTVIFRQKIGDNFFKQYLIKDHNHEVSFQKKHRPEKHKPESLTILFPGTTGRRSSPC